MTEACTSRALLYALHHHRVVGEPPGFLTGMAERPVEGANPHHRELTKRCRYID